MSSEKEYFFTVDDEKQLEIPKIKGSRFIALLFPARNQAEVKMAIQSAKNQFPDASHHCFAYRLQAKELIQHSSDDGEPSGTAGMPILRQLESFDLRDVALVVVRYFGGTQLGKGGLIRAYGSAAKVLLEESSLVQKMILSYVKVKFPYTDTSIVNTVMAKYKVEVTDREFDQETRLTLAMSKHLKKEFIDSLKNALSGSLDWEEVGDSYG